MKCVCCEDVVSYDREGIEQNRWKFAVIFHWSAIDGSYFARTDYGVIFRIVQNEEGWKVNESRPGMPDIETQVHCKADAFRMIIQ